MAAPVLPAPVAIVAAGLARAGRLGLPLHNNPADPRVVRNAHGDEVLDTYGYGVPRGPSDELARLIVTAVNSHDRLVSLASATLAAFEAIHGVPLTAEECTEAVELRALLAELLAPAEVPARG